MAENILKELRSKLVDGLTEPVISALVDDLLERKVLGDEEKEEIRQKMKTRANQARELIDGVKRKGNKASGVMLTCLKTRDETLYDNLEIDKLLRVPETEVSSSHTPETTTGSTTDKPNTMVEYKMDSIPRGLCLIINNINFGKPESRRNGSQKDTDSLKEVFESLGFQVEIKTDQTVSDMKMIVKQYSEDGRHGDCFVCCVMSHGNETGVFGCDEQLCPLNDIISPFDGVNCRSLAGKPKVFFIQACRGHDIQSKVLVSDGLSSSCMGKSGKKCSIAKDSDFLIARSTVDGYVSVRDVNSGSWFIQSLCENLKVGSKRGDDILSILTNVNNDVSQNEGFLEVNGDIVDAKVTPELTFTMRKKLIFRPQKKSGWFS